MLARPHEAHRRMRPLLAVAPRDAVLKVRDLAAAAPPADAVERRLRRVDQRLHPMAIPGRARGARLLSRCASAKLQCCSCMRAWG